MISNIYLLPSVSEADESLLSNVYIYIWFSLRQKDTPLRLFRTFGTVLVVVLLQQLKIATFIIMCIIHKPIPWSANPSLSYK